ncbi:MAG: alanyl-tRNA editing protein [Candidatus Diapherotrites archaeon]|nr:alanyl-tRNA editing protein [Candidatus Diapherotrites archaeon]
MAVKKLFILNPHQTECKAHVTKKEDNTIWLDQTIFFAFSGGQATDKGTINGINVVNAKAEKETKEIAYTLEDASSLNVEDEVDVKIDPEHRAKIRRLHSAAHLADYAMLELQGEKEIIGSNCTADKARLDYLTNEPVGPFLAKAQERVNHWVDEDVEIKREEDPTTPGKWLWLWKNKTMPCGGTHCTHTGEIGHVKLKRKNIGGGKERVEVTLLA